MRKYKQKWIWYTSWSASWVISNIKSPVALLHCKGTGRVQDLTVACFMLLFAKIVCCSSHIVCLVNFEFSTEILSFFELILGFPQKLRLCRLGCGRIETLPTVLVALGRGLAGEEPSWRKGEGVLCFLYFQVNCHLDFVMSNPRHVIKPYVVPGCSPISFLLSWAFFWNCS